jgi:hypothetical protein
MPEELSTSTGSMNTDHELEVLELEAKRGGWRQHSRAHEDVKRRERHIKLGEQLRDAARHGSMPAVKEILHRAEGENFNQQEVVVLCMMIIQLFGMPWLLVATKLHPISCLLELPPI